MQSYDWLDGVPDTLARQLRFLMEADRLKLVSRGNHIADGSRRENTAEHSWHLALFATILSDYANEPVNLARVIQMLLVHDLVEIDAGDTPLFDEQGTATQAHREHLAAERLFGMLPIPQGGTLKQVWIEFEQAETADARFAKALDRFQPILLNHAVGGGTWQDYKADEDRERRLTQRIAAGSKELWYTAERVFADAVQKGWLRPSPGLQTASKPSHSERQPSSTALPTQSEIGEPPPLHPIAAQQLVERQTPGAEERERVDLSTWERRELYLLFRGFAEPYHGVCLRMDCTATFLFAKKNGLSVFLSLVHRSLLAAQEVEHFRTRMEGDDVWLYKRILAGSAVGRANGTIGFGHYQYHAAIEDFVREASVEVERVGQARDLETHPEVNLIRYSVLPWFDFTSISHARDLSRPDSAPRITFGKITEANGRYTMPVSIHVHHALADGLHVSRFVTRFQRFLDEPTSTILDGSA